jgi:hypothetical protein
VTPSRDTLLAQEPQPTIVIVCEKQPVPGQLGSFQLVPRVSFTNMPGGWDTAFKMLMHAAGLVMQEMVMQARQEGERRIAVVPALPGELVKQ